MEANELGLIFILIVSFVYNFSLFSVLISHYYDCKIECIKDLIALDCAIELKLFLGDDFRSGHLNHNQSGVKLARTYSSNRLDLGPVINNIYANFLLKAPSHPCIE